MTEEGLAELKDKKLLSGMMGKNRELPIGARLTTDTEAIDSMSFNAAMVILVYLLSYVLLKIITFLLSFAGKLGTDPLQTSGALTLFFLPLLHFWSKLF